MLGCTGGVTHVPCAKPRSATLSVESPGCKQVQSRREPRDEASPATTGGGHCRRLVRRRHAHTPSGTSTPGGDATTWLLSPPELRSVGRAHTGTEIRAHNVSTICEPMVDSMFACGSRGRRPFMAGGLLRRLRSAATRGSALSGPMDKGSKAELPWPACAALRRTMQICAISRIARSPCASQVSRWRWLHRHAAPLSAPEVAEGVRNGGVRARQEVRHQTGRVAVAVALQSWADVPAVALLLVEHDVRVARHWPTSTPARTPQRCAAIYRCLPRSWSWCSGCATASTAGETFAAIQALPRV